LQNSSFAKNYLLCSQTWLPTVQEVLHADWQEAGHSPQPPVRRVFFSIALFTVKVCFLICITSQDKIITILFYLFLPFFARAFALKKQRKTVSVGWLFRNLKFA